MNLKFLEYFKKIIIRELEILSSDRNIIMIAIIAPIFYSLFYGTLYINKSEEKVNIAVVDYDNSKLSKELIHNLSLTQMLSINLNSANYYEARKSIENFSNNAIVIIPKDFEKNILSQRGITIKLFLNTSRFLISNDINKSVNEVVSNLNYNYKKEYFLKKGINVKQIQEFIEPIRLDYRPLYNKLETYGDFLIPAIFVIILHQALLIALSESIAKERERGSIRDLISSSKTKLLCLMGGKSLPYFLLFFIYANFFLFVNYYIFKLPLTGNFILIEFSVIIFLLAVISFGLFISTFFKRKIIALQVLAFTSYPIFLITGYSWPMQVIPLPLKLLANLIPITPFITIFQKITVMGAIFQNIYGEILQLIILIIFYLSLSYILFIKKYFNFQKVII